MEDLLAIRGFPTGLARSEGKALIRRLRATRESDEADLIPYPKGISRGPARPSPELEATVERLKVVRNSIAEQLGLPRGTLLSNAILLEIARVKPLTLEDLVGVEAMRAWKIDLAGEALLGALRND